MVQHFYPDTRVEESFEKTMLAEDKNQEIDIMPM
jgi:hypothetical protein